MVGLDFVFENEWVRSTLLYKRLPISYFAVNLGHPFLFLVFLIMWHMIGVVYPCTLGIMR